MYHFISSSSSIKRDFPTYYFYPPLTFKLQVNHWKYSRHYLLFLSVIFQNEVVSETARKLINKIIEIYHKLFYMTHMFCKGKFLDESIFFETPCISCIYQFVSSWCIRTIVILLSYILFFPFNFYKRPVNDRHKFLHYVSFLSVTSQNVSGSEISQRINKISKIYLNRHICTGKKKFQICIHLLKHPAQHISSYEIDVLDLIIHLP